MELVFWVMGWAGLVSWVQKWAGFVFQGKVVGGACVSVQRVVGFVSLGQDVGVIFVSGSGSGRGLFPGSRSGQGLCFLAQEVGWVCVSWSGSGWSLCFCVS